MQNLTLQPRLPQDSHQIDSCNSLVRETQSKDCVTYKGPLSHVGREELTSPTIRTYRPPVTAYLPSQQHTDARPEYFQCSAAFQERFVPLLATRGKSPTRCSVVMAWRPWRWELHVGGLELTVYNLYRSQRHQLEAGELLTMASHTSLLVAGDFKPPPHPAVSVGNQPDGSSLSRVARGGPSHPSPNTGKPTHAGGGGGDWTHLGVG
ncbi:hypothetical protein GWK47_023778 [Chionoecetes opilio]|uniref:Uncharacterized protein n=1 Tax=Chionoecetes opilio TaxID=41210 RepID=A0A8J4XW17_CHIOP|nr:hypothetical protein GWK47_023778 [Chionoecetes opilio]